MIDSDENDRFDLGVKGLFVLLICLTSLPSVLLTMPIAIGPLISKSDLHVYYTHFEITNGPCNLIGSNWCDLFMNRTIFCFKSHLFPANEQATLKTKSNQANCRKMIDKEYCMTNFATFVSKTLTSPLLHWCFWCKDWS